MQLRVLVSSLLAFTLFACGGSSEADPTPEKKNPPEDCGDRVDGNGDGLDDYADPDCAFGEELRDKLQGIADWARGPVVGLVLGMEMPDGTVGLVKSGHVAVGGRELQVTDRFPVGSITKTFTAVLTLQLRDEGKLSLDDTLSRWNPEFPRAERIQVRHLLSHTSGIFSYAEDDGYLAKLLAGGRFVPSELLEIAASNPPHFEPGEDFSYSNSNFILLGTIIEAVTGNTVAAEMRERIFEPLGMNDTFLLGSDKSPGRLEVHGYLASGLGRDMDVTMSWNGTSSWTSGAILTSAPDLLRFSHGLTKGELLPYETFAEMISGVGRPEYGFGLILGNGWVGHGGAVPGWHAEWLFLGDGTTIVALQNRYDGGISAARAANEAAKLY